MFVWGYVDKNVGASQGQKRALDILELVVLKAIVSFPT